MKPKHARIDDRLRLVQALWDSDVRGVVRLALPEYISISAEPEQLELTEAQQQELSRRLTDRQINRKSVVSWEDTAVKR